MIKVKITSLLLLSMFFGLILVDSATPAASESKSAVNPMQKMSPFLQSLVQNGTNCWVEVIIIFTQGAGLSADNLLASYAAQGELQIETSYTIISGCLVNLHSSILCDLAENPFIASLWENGVCHEAIDDMQPTVAQAMSEFVNYTQEIDATDFYNVPGMNTNGSSAVIAILDSGVDISGEIQTGGDLAYFGNDTSVTNAKFLGAVSMCPDDTIYYADFMGRGTFDAGVACGTGRWNSAYQGVAPGAYYLSVKIFDPLGITYWSFIISGIEWAIEHGADIILFGGFLPGLYSDPISLALDAAADLGIFVVVPAGDDGPSYMSIDSPGQTEKAICVGAYNSSSGQVANFSSCGPSLDFRTGPDVIAPGVDLISTRAKIYASSGSLGAFSFGGLNIGGIEIPGGSVGGLSEFVLPNGSFPAPTYGTAVNENYTRASGTGVAAAVVAGAIALLIQVFPSVTPALMKIALMRTAHPITSEENQEGAGLIDVYAAYQYLQQYLTTSSIYNFPVTAPLIYPGAIVSIDSQNYSQSESNLPSSWQYWDSAVLFSTQAMMTAAVIVNATDFNYTMVDLPLNQFGVMYNLAGESGEHNNNSNLLSQPLSLESLLPSPDNNSFHWFSEFQVIREMHLATDLPIGPDQYRRYEGVLAYGPLMVVVVVETYDYLSAQNSSAPLGLTVTNRLNAFKMDFYFINTGPIPINNLTLYSYFKADMFLNISTNASSLASYSNAQQLMPLSPNKNVTFDNSTDTIYASDEDTNNDLCNSTWNVMGFNSTNRQDSGWEIADGINLLLDITLNHTALTNTSSWSAGEDPGWAMRWPISSSLVSGTVENFTSVFGLGVSPTQDSALSSFQENMEAMTSNVTIYNVTDMLILDTNFLRVSYVNEVYDAQARFINVGNTAIQQTDLTFIANRTLPNGQVVGSFFDTTVNNVTPFEIVTAEAQWQPINEGVYSCAWAAGGPEALLGSSNEITFLNNYLARNIFIISESKYDAFADAVMYVTPTKMPNAPFTLMYPGDLGICNITIISVRRTDILQIGYQGWAKSIFNFNQSVVNVTNGYGNLVGIILVPLIGASSFIQGSLTFYRGNGNPICTVPVQFSVQGNRGRILFDFVHNNLTISITNTTIDFGWERRLYSTYGTFYNVRDVWAHTSDKGASTMTVVPDITMNLSQYGLDVSMLNQSGAAGNILQKFLGPYTLTSNIITTNTTNHDILQLFDVLVICAPVVAFTQQEITDITNWVDAGGDLLVWAKNASQCNVSSLNDLLSKFNLEVAGNNTTPVLLTPDNRTNNPIFTNVGNILLQDSVNFTQIQGNPDANPSVLSAPGASTAPVAVSQYGLGKVVAVGDMEMFDAAHLSDYNNTGFAENILNWFFERKFTWNLTMTPAQPVQINLGEKAYVNLEAIGDYAANATQQVIYLSGFGNSTGGSIQVNLFGTALPVLPLFHSDGSNFVGEFDSTWNNCTGMVYMTIYIDAAAFPSETFLFPINVSSGPPVPATIIYQFPPPAYPHIYDIVGIISIVVLIAFLWFYREEKWRNRLRVTILKGETLFEAQTRVNEIKALLKQVNRGLDSDVDPLEKIRLLLNNYKRMQNTLQEFKKFGDKIGES